MRGAASGDAERSRTAPLPSGLTVLTAIAVPCAGGVPKPSSKKMTGVLCSWMSGPVRSARVCRKPPASSMLEVSGPWPCSCSAAAFAGLAAVINDSSSIR
jgi:hypothetical protein